MVLVGKKVAGSQWLGRADRGGAFRIPGLGTGRKEKEEIRHARRWSGEAAPEKVRDRAEPPYRNWGLAALRAWQRWNIDFSK